MMIILEFCRPDEWGRDNESHHCISHHHLGATRVALNATGRLLRS